MIKSKIDSNKLNLLESTISDTMNPAGAYLLNGYTTTTDVDIDNRKYDCTKDGIVLWVGHHSYLCRSLYSWPCSRRFK